MIRAIRRLLTLPAGIDALVRLRVRYIQALSILAMVASVLGILSQTLANSNSNAVPITAAFFVGGLGLLVLVRQ
jgi:hypothetical protein